MANDLTTTRKLSTPEGARALRLIECSAAWGETDPCEARRWLGPTIADALPAAIEEAQALLAPATISDAKRHLAPTLAIVAPIGMTAADQSAWLATVTSDLSGIPADLLERGCKAARRVADHPAKILAAIHAEIDGTWTKRRRDLARAREIAEFIDAPTQDRRPWERGDTPGDPGTWYTPQRAAAIYAEEGYAPAEARVAQTRHAGPPRTPTEADYIALMGEAAYRAAQGAAAEDEREVRAA